MRQSSDRGAATARVLVLSQKPCANTVDKKALPEKWSGVVPSYRTTSKPDTVVADAYSHERIMQRLEKEGSSSSSWSSSETIILPPEHMDDMDDE